MHIFVTGTDTKVGKTVVSALLCLKLRRRYWKPIQSGTDSTTDSQWMASIIGASNICSETYKLTQPLSPHLAARLDGIQIHTEKIRAYMNEVADTLIVEGVGGLLVPLNERELVIDLIASTPCQCVLVARSALGTINHTLMSLEALRSRKIEPIGVVMVGAENPENRLAIEKYGHAKVIASLPWLTDLQMFTLQKSATQIFKEEWPKWM